MDESGLQKIKQAFAVAKKRLASLRMKRARILKKGSETDDARSVEDIRSKIGKL